MTWWTVLCFIYACGWSANFGALCKVSKVRELPWAKRILSLLILFFLSLTWPFNLLTQIIEWSVERSWRDK